MGGCLTRRLGVTSGVVTDPNFANTILLVGGNGTNGVAADAPDESFAAHGNGVSSGSGVTDAVYDTANKVFGVSSIRFDSGFNDLVRWSDHADWTLGTSDFTIEMWLRLSSNTVTQTIIGHWNTTGNQRGWCLSYNGGDATDTLKFFGSSDGSTTTTIATSSAWTPTVDDWYFVCAERSGNTFRIYAGQAGGTATMIATASNAISLFNSSAPLQLSGQTQSEATCMNGNIDELRVTLGVARYANDAGFAVPTAAFPRS